MRESSTARPPTGALAPPRRTRISSWRWMAASEQGREFRRVHLGHAYRRPAAVSCAASRASARSRLRRAVREADRQEIRLVHHPRRCVPIHGATMQPFGRHHGDPQFPSEDRSKGRPNGTHYRIVGSNGVLRLSVNGKEVSGGEDCNYRKGYLRSHPKALRSIPHVRIKELPSSETPANLPRPRTRACSRSSPAGSARRETNAAIVQRWGVLGEPSACSPAMRIRRHAWVEKR